jgi:hypothetical protein
MLRVTRKKLLEFDNATSTTDGTMAPPNTPATKTPRKKATPKTQSTKGKATKKRKVAVYSDDSEDDDESPIKKKTVVKAEPVNEDSEASAGAGADSDSAEVEATWSFAGSKNASGSMLFTNKINHNGKME